MWLFIHSIVTLFLLVSIRVSALSTAPRPLKRIDHPYSVAFDILPHHSNIYGRRSSSSDPNTLLHSDSFRLTFSAFEETYYIHLRPNDNLIHPAARIHYYSTTLSGETILTHTEPLIRESIKVYWGEVVPAHLTATRLKYDASNATPDHRGNLGWARIMVHSQGDPVAGKPSIFEGAFTINGTTYHVMSADNYVRNKDDLDPHISIPGDHPASSLVIWRDSDTYTEHEEVILRTKHGLSPVISPIIRPTTCAHDALVYNTDPSENAVLRHPVLPGPWYDPLGYLDHLATGPNSARSKRSDVNGTSMGTNFINNIGQTVGCPTSQKVVYMGVAADCTYTQRYGDQSKATQQILNDWNSASSVYKSTFNISLGIVELQVYNGTCPTTADPAIPWNIACGSVTLNDRLSLFSQWRGNKGDDGTGLWHLLSQCTSGSEVGIAWLATLCQTTAAGSAPNVVSGTGVSTAGRTEWQVIAHEIGHNFGAIHDCVAGCSLSDGCCPLTSTTCNANSAYIMSPTASDSEMQFSQCSIGNICSLMQVSSGGKINTSCILDPDASRHIISLQMCGNGIVEVGEDCDPGIGVNSACCNSTTCKFKTGAICDPSSSSCCTSACSFASKTQLCRPAKDPSCDTAEYCTGTSATCPTDVTVANGKSCGSNGLACASGVCTSLDLQCKNSGTSMNLTTACPSKNDQSCMVNCEDPTSSNQCIVVQTPLINGSPCGYGGSCSNGSCKAGSAGAAFKSWYSQNLQISVPVTVFVGIIAIIIIWSLFRHCYRPKPKAKDIRY